MIGIGIAMKNEALPVKSGIKEMGESVSECVLVWGGTHWARHSS
jgi:hypothetical protein